VFAGRSILATISCGLLVTSAIGSNPFRGVIELVDDAADMGVPLAMSKV